MHIIWPHITSIDPNCSFLMGLYSVPLSCLLGNTLFTVLFFRERERALNQAGVPAIQPQRTDGPRFTGGGFNLKSTKTAA